MQKVIFIICCLIVISGCAVKKKKSSVSPIWGEKKGNLLEEIYDFNLSNGDYDIQKAEVEITNKGERKRLLITIKFRLPDEYLMSVKSRNGIEAARIYFNEDTLLINDKFNRTLYYTSASFLRKKYGLSPGLLKLITGDILKEYISETEKILCTQGSMNMKYISEEKIVSHKIDCEKRKIVETIVSYENDEELVRLNFQDFILAEGRVIPEKILIHDLVNDTEIVLGIQKIVSNPESDIEFIPGANYRKVLLK